MILGEERERERRGSGREGEERVGGGGRSKGGRIAVSKNTCTHFKQAFMLVYYAPPSTGMSRQIHLPQQAVWVNLR